MKHLFLILLFINVALFDVSSESTTGSRETTKRYEAVRSEFEVWKLIIECRSLLISALIEQESNGNQLAYNAKEDAAGVLQIRPIMIKEVNRLVGYDKYSDDDRWDEYKSVEIFIDYQNSVNTCWDFELASRKWNGGNTGHLKESTKEYWSSVKRKINIKNNANEMKHGVAYRIGIKDDWKSLLAEMAVSSL